MIIGALQHSDHFFCSSVFNHYLHFSDTGRLPKLLGLQVNIKMGKALVWLQTAHAEGSSLCKSLI